MKFEGIKINQCYQLYSGTVITEYDPSWESVLSFDPLDTENVPISENQGQVLAQNNVKIADILEAFSCDSTQRKDLIGLIAEQDALAQRAQKNDSYSPEQTSQILADVNDTKAQLNSLLSCCESNPNGRIQAGPTCPSPVNIKTSVNSKNTFYSQLPVKVFKPLIIMVNGHYSKVIPGPSFGGAAYWSYFDPSAENSTRNLFNSSNAQIIYADGSSLFGFDTDYSDRFLDGQNHVDDKYLKDWKSINGDAKIYIVGHSEGCAMAAGIADQLVKKYKKTVNEMLLLSCDEGREIGAKVNSTIPTYQLEYMYWDKDNSTQDCEPSFDWVIGTNIRWKTYSGISGVRKFGIITRNNLSLLTVHGSSANINDLFINKRLEELKGVTYTQNMDGNGKVYYSQSLNVKYNRFFKIGDKIIRPTYTCDF